MNIPINIETLLNGKVVESERIDYKKGTGIPTIKKVMEANGSPPAKYDTDGDERRFFVTELPVHQVFKDEDSHDSNPVSDSVSNQVSNQVRHEIKDYLPSTSNEVENLTVVRVITILEFCNEPKTKKEIFNKIKLSAQTKNYKQTIEPAIKSSLLAMTIPDKPNSRLQKYITTGKGKKIIGNGNN